DHNLPERAYTAFPDDQFPLSIESDRVQLTYEEAMSSFDAKGLYRPMIRELQKTKKFDTVDLVRPPTDRKTVGSRWIFAQKQDGTLTAIWVAQGFSRSAGIEYGETFSPVCHVGSVRLILALASKKEE
ncbi:unnamed protein product, partial [Discosporangium mesarthrocarpum]